MKSWFLCGFILYSFLSGNFLRAESDQEAQQHSSFLRTLAALKYGTEDYSHLGEPFASYYLDLQTEPSLILESGESIYERYEDSLVVKHHLVLKYIFGKDDTLPELSYDEPIQTLFWQVIPQGDSGAQHRLYRVTSKWLSVLPRQGNDWLRDVNIRSVLASTLERIYFGSDRTFRRPTDLLSLYRIHRLSIPNLDPIIIEGVLSKQLGDRMSGGDLKRLVAEVSGEIDINEQAMKIYWQEFYDSSSHVFSMRADASKVIEAELNQSDATGAPGLLPDEIGEDLMKELEMFSHFSGLGDSKASIEELLKRFASGKIDV